MLIEPQVHWTTAAPLWQSRTNNDTQPDSFVKPAILRFATDEFMDHFLNVVNYDPERLDEWEAQPETWEEPAPIPEPPKTMPPFLQELQQTRLKSQSNFAQVSTIQTPIIPPSVDLPLKLYQPAHQRFYMVSASLVCQMQGLPDRKLDLPVGERTSFVVRRLRPKAGTTPSVFNLDTCDEYAFVNGGWQRVTTANEPDAEILVPGEEQLPLFGNRYTADDGRKRRILAGMIPVGRRQEYVGVPFTSSPLEDNGENEVDPYVGRMSFFDTKVTSPWRGLLDVATRASEVAATVGDGLAKADSQEEAEAILEDSAAFQLSTASQQQEISWYTLLDFATFLKKYLGNVWESLSGETVTLSSAEQDLVTELENATDSGTNLADALVAIEPHRATLESVVSVYTPGNTDFQLIPLFNLVPASVSFLATDTYPGSDDILLNGLIRAALPETATVRVPEPDITVKQAKQNREEAWFVIRCCFERPNCTPVFLPLLSDATVPFQMASFFDTDAPVRSIRIPMPKDTTPAGLRKFAKGAAFEMSNKLCAQVEHAKNLTLGDLVLSVLPWPFHKGLPEPDNDTCDDGGLTFGMICSLSIPIVTIAALILLLIIVALFDIIFKWFPYLFVCLPIPGLGSKDDS